MNVALDVDHDQLVSGPLEGEVAEGLGRLPAVAGRVRHKARVGVVLGVLPVYVVLDVEERGARPLHKFHHAHQEYVNLSVNKVYSLSLKTSSFKISFTFLGGLCLLYSSPHSLASI